jgi:hypothetical protein
MSKPITVLLATAVAVFGIVSFAGAAGTKRTRHNAVTVVGVLGPPVKVAPGKFVKAYAFCPKGYFVVGGGSYSGAISEVVSSPTADLRGWFIDGTNYDKKTTFTHRADAVCMKGSTSVPVGTAASDGPAVRQAEAQALARR